MHELICCQCKSKMWLPDALYTSARASEKIIFYCAYGHEQHFRKGESEEVVLRRERDRLQQRLAQRDDEIAAQTALIANLKKQRRIVNKRISNGTCPCCHRTFENLALHMKGKHPEFRAEAA